MRISCLGVFFITLLFLVQSTYAQQWGLEWDFVARGLSFVTGLPQDMFRTFPDFLYRLLLPFLLIWFIVLGFLKQIRIFTRAPTWIEWFISFAMAALAVFPTGAFAWFVSWLAGIGGAYATLVFLVMFGLGVWLYSWRWGAAALGRGSALKDFSSMETDVRDRMARLVSDLTHGRIAPDKYEKEMEKLRKTLDDIRVRKKTLLEG